jgi:hypothetical protein
MYNLHGYALSFCFSFFKYIERFPTIYQRFRVLPVLEVGPADESHKYKLEYAQ